MPFTPFHGGPGLVFKAISPGGFSLTAFLATQVAIDCETAFHMIRREYPLHRQFHSLIGGTIVGCAISLIAVASTRRPAVRRLLGSEAVSHSELTLWGTLTGGVLGGTSHSILDSIVHADVRPFWPFSSSSPFYGCIGWNAVEWACVLSGVIGAVLLYSRRARVVEV
jgi:membrane-bound metal-dependent hydrolase YbcI (DUF457 family)